MPVISAGPRLLAAWVEGELHDVGARMVADFFEMDGWDTTCLGANTPGDALIEALRARGATLVAISATLDVHVHTSAELIAAVRASPDLAHVRIIVGGRPFQLAPAL